MSIKQLDNGRCVCPECGDDYKRLNTHWNRSECDFPEPDNNVKEVLTGIYLTGPKIKNREGYANPKITKGYHNRKSLEWLSDRLGFWATNIYQSNTDPEKLKQSMENNFGKRPETVSNRYVLSSRTIPYLDELSKTSPEDLHFSEQVMRILFAFCGYSKPNIVFRSKNIYKLQIYLRSNGFEVSWTNEGSKTRSPTVGLNIKSSKDFYNMIEDKSVPGFEYKWGRLDSQF